MENNEILNDEIIDDTELVNSEEPSEPSEELHEESSRDLLEEKIVSGKALIKYTEKIKEAIAEAKESSSDIERLEQAIAKLSANVNLYKEEIIDRCLASLDEAYAQVSEKIDAVDQKLDLLIEKFNKFVPTYIEPGDEIGQVTTYNLLDPEGTYPAPYGTAYYCPNLTEIVQDLRDGKDVALRNRTYSDIIYTEDIDTDPATSSEPISKGGLMPKDDEEDTPTVSYQIPSGLTIYECYDTSSGYFIISDNLFVSPSGDFMPSNQKGKMLEAKQMIDNFINGNISFEEYSEYFEPYKHTFICYSLNGGLAPKSDYDGTIIKTASSSRVIPTDGPVLGKYIILTDIPKDQFVEEEGQK